MERKSSVITETKEQGRRKRMGADKWDSSWFLHKGAHRKEFTVSLSISFMPSVQVHIRIITMSFWQSIVLAWATGPQWKGSGYPKVYILMKFSFIKFSLGYKFQLRRETWVLVKFHHCSCLKLYTLASKCLSYGGQTAGRLEIPFSMYVFVFLKWLSF